MLQYTYDLDMTPGNAPLVIHLNQYDDNWRLIFNLFSSSGTLDIESGSTASIRGTKADGNGYSVNVTYDEPRTRVVVGGYNQMTAAAGRNVFELVMQNSSGKILSTANFIVDVEPAALDADTIVSQSILKELNSIIESASTASTAAKRADAALAKIASYSDPNNDGNLTVGGTQPKGILSGSVSTNVGLTVQYHFVTSIGLLSVRITGTTSAALVTSAGYYDLCVISALSSYMTLRGLRLIAYNSGYRGQISIMSNGTVQLGYTRKSDTSEATDVPQGTQMYINELFIMS